jgi:urocanate hydratase
MNFWDYGNAFLCECYNAGAEILAKNAKDDKSFKYPSYFQDIMGDIFSMGFGPFRWVCASNKAEDLQLTDKIAFDVLDKLVKDDSGK